MKAQAEVLLQLGPFLYQPPAPPLTGVSLNRRSFRSLIFAGWRPPARRLPLQEGGFVAVYVGRPGFAFRCYGWARAPSSMKSLSAGVPRRRQKEIWDRAQRPVECEGAAALMRPLAARSGDVGPPTSFPRSCTRAPIPSRTARGPSPRWPPPASCGARRSPACA